MKKNNFSKIAVVFTLILALTTISPLASAQEYQDFDEIMNTGISLTSEQSLKLANPSKDISVQSDYYYITGSSNSKQPLLCNGEEVTNRGRYGSFGVYAPLKMGGNTFQFKNGEASVSITITRGSPSASVPTITKIKNAYPNYDDLAYSGDEYTLRCTAPANGSVTAKLGDESITLKQEVAASTGVEAYYSTKITLPQVGSSSMESLGAVTFYLSYKGNSSEKASSGSVIVAGENAIPVVCVSQNAAIVYEEGNDQSNFISTLSLGAADRVVGSNKDFYQLSMGGWVSKGYASLQKEGTKYKTKVSSVDYDTDSSGGESFLIKGTANAAFKAYDTSEKVSIKLYNTTGLDSIPVSDSGLFSSIHVLKEDNAVTLDFMKRSAGNLIGYNLSYDNAGNTILYFNPLPNLSGGEKPLKGINVIIDPGHGGYDVGALGVLYSNGPNEKDITLATSIATKNRLESLGANVTMTVDKSLSKDRKVELTDRIQIANESKADFFLSLHCNSIAANANGLKPSGTEIYYFENNSKILAEKMLASITSYTNRTVRSAQYGYYYVTRNPICVSMLIEMGFISNPVEYDNLRDPQVIFKTANAIGDTLVAYVK